MSETAAAGARPEPEQPTPALHVVPEPTAQAPARRALPAKLRRAVMRIVRTPRLLVACDYDGTLAPIVADPREAVPTPESVTALRSLATLHDTTVAVISGRALRDLATLSRLPAEVHLLGSHGSEFDLGFLHDLGPQDRELLGRLREELESLVTASPGAYLEAKPAGFAVHLRQMDPASAEWLKNRILNGPAVHGSVHVTEGFEVVELSVIATDKGDALDRMRRDASATAAVFIGDSVTDEKAFGRLSGPDVGVRVGKGATAAHFRVSGPDVVPVLLALLVDERRGWLYGGSAPPIERLSMLGGGRSVALLTPEARLTWFCHPEPDSAALFADLVGGPGAGHFTVTPERPTLPLEQRYVPGTMTVQTRWSQVMVTDYLDDGDAPHRTDLVRVLDGSAPVRVEFAPRPEFGASSVHLLQHDDGLEVSGTAEPIVLRSPGVTWQIESDGRHDTAVAVVTPAPGEPVVLELRCGTSDLGPHPLAEPERRERGQRHWSDWVASLTLPPVRPELVGRSALTLRALCHNETGAIMAAATTSLPEDVGGVRNWDYRYCWLRDAALSAQALVSLGSTDEARGYLTWLRGVLDAVSHPRRLRPLYSLAGRMVGSEAVIDSLPGYAGSRPVRVGNLANHQVQLDVFGPVVDMIADFAAATGTLSDDAWSLVRAMADGVARRWHEPDHGIWEERKKPRHHVYSKTMCWLTLDRALRIAEAHDREADRHWQELRDKIAADVLEHGWNADVGAYTAAYDGADLDAASLHVGLSGLLAPDDPRFVATVTVVEEGLRAGGTVYRYRHDDGLPGDEGGFHLCTAWLVEAYLLVGRRADAEELFARLAASAGPTGLLPEEYDPVAERSLGNHPQAYSHLGLIRCARLLSPPPGDDGL